MDDCFICAIIGRYKILLIKDGRNLWPSSCCWIKSPIILDCWLFCLRLMRVGGTSELEEQVPHLLYMNSTPLSVETCVAKNGTLSAKEGGLGRLSKTPKFDPSWGFKSC